MRAGEEEGATDEERRLGLGGDQHYYMHSYGQHAIAMYRKTKRERRDRQQADRERHIMVHRQTRQKDRQAERDRHRDRETETETDRKSGRKKGAKTERRH